MSSLCAKSSTPFLTILSPHLDDAALCLGGLLEHLVNVGHGDKVNIVNVFTESVYVRNGFADVERTRESVSRYRASEDAAYCSRRGLNVIYLKFPDSSVIGISDEDESIVPIDGDSRCSLVEPILAQHIREPRFVACPLCVGNHIDHRIVRLIAENCAGSLQRVIFYEDLPYSCTAPAAFNNAHASVMSQEYCLLPVQIQGTIEDKKCGLKCYPSQLDSDAINQVIDFAYMVGNGLPVERLLVPSNAREEFCSFITA